MLITCPSCAAEYDVPGTLAAGRLVRCARCGNQWAPVAPEPPPPVAEAPPDDPPAPFVSVAPPAPLVPALPAEPARRWPLQLAWLGSAVVILMLLAAAFVWRDPVMAAWPPSIRVYGALGLTAHP